MKTCTFFGHRDCPDSVYPILFNTIVDLIKNGNVSRFFVGDHGNFDTLTIRIFKELIPLYPEIKFFVVLAYIPTNKGQLNTFISENSLIPDNIETVPKKFAIVYRNKWLIQHSDIVITYITHPFGGTSQFAELAKRKNKEIINLA